MACKLITRLYLDQPRFWQYVLLLISIGYILAFAILASIRLFYPYELEWIEGAKIDQMRWILGDKPLYGPPDIHFIPFAYTPLFFYLSAGLMKWLGVGFLAPRLISTLSTLGCFLFIYLIVTKDNPRPIPGMIAAGIYAACFALTGAWMDLAKVDALFMLLLLAAFFTSQGKPNRTMSIISGILFTLAYFTKQLALPVIILFAPMSLIISRGRTWLVWLTAVVLGVCAVWILDYSSQGWFSFYTFQTLTRHTIVSGWLPFWKLLIPKIWPSLLVILTLMFFSQGKALPWKRAWSENTLHILGFSLALILTSWSIFFKIWTYNNDLMPACAGIAILSGLSSRDFFTAVKSDLHSQVQKEPLIETVVICLLLFQFASLIYNPIELLPNSKTTHKAEKIILRLQSLPGEVLSFHHGFINYLAGKNTYLHTTPLADVIIGSFPSDTNAYHRQKEAERIFNQAVSEQMFDWIVLDKFQPAWLPYYIHAGCFMREIETNYPGRNSSMIPKLLLTRNPIANGGELPLEEPRLYDMFLEGWSAPLNGERLANGERASVAIALEGLSSYKLLITARPFCPGDKAWVDSMDITWNSRSIGKLNFNTCNLITGEFFIHAGMLRDKDYNRLSFEFFPSTALISVPPNHSKMNPAIYFSVINLHRQ